MNLLKFLSYLCILVGSFNLVAFLFGQSILSERGKDANIGADLTVALAWLILGAVILGYVKLSTQIKELKK